MICICIGIPYWLFPIGCSLVAVPYWLFRIGIRDSRRPGTFACVCEPGMLMQTSRGGAWNRGKERHKPKRSPFASTVTYMHIKFTYI